MSPSLKQLPQKQSLPANMDSYVRTAIEAVAGGGGGAGVGSSGLGAGIAGAELDLQLRKISVVSQAPSLMDLEAAADGGTEQQNSNQHPPKTLLGLKKKKSIKQEPQKMLFKFEKV